MKVTIREATLQDIPDLVQLRRIMFDDMGFSNLDELKASDQASEKYFKKPIPRREFHGWLAFNIKNEAIASGGLVFDEHPPGPDNITGQIGYIMNIVTLPKYRRKGIARRIMKEILLMAEKKNINLITLHSTEKGKSLYEELGFEISNEMKLILK